MKKIHLFALIALGLVLLLSLSLALSCFSTALHARELWPWLLSQSEPGAEGAMYTLEDQQFKWTVAGAVLLLPGLCALAGGACLWGRLRKRKKAGENRP